VVPISLSVVTKKVGKRRVRFARVTFNTGLTQEVVVPFQQPAYGAVAAALADLDGNGLLDAVRFTVRMGSKMISRVVTL
jgi:hypothetical protein